ncbi:MAG TPA: hypothetical protein VID47_17675 [Actinomycetota bacterium]|jgi:hypothetical protein
MRADFYREADPETVVGTARWNGRRAEVESEDAEVRGTLSRMFRATPVVVDDPSLRPAGTSGEAVVQPGSLEWFRLAAIARAPGADLRVRLVPEVEVKTGWDPASAYRTFRQVVTGLESPVTPISEPAPEIAKPV